MNQSLAYIIDIEIDRLQSSISSDQSKFKLRQGKKKSIFLWKRYIKLYYFFYNSFKYKAVLVYFIKGQDLIGVFAFSRCYNGTFS